MATLGEELREAREKKGLTLEQIAETTRISHTFLKALEEDNYTVIPGDVFVTGFLRSYARELGIDEKHVLARYRDVHPQHNEEAQPAAPQAAEVQHFPKPSLLRIRRAHHPANKKTSLYFIILGGLLLGALLTGITMLLTPKEPNPEIPPAPPVVATRKPAPPPQPFNQATTAFKPVTTAKTPTTPAPPAGKAAMPVRTSHKRR